MPTPAPSPMPSVQPTPTPSSSPSSMPSPSPTKYPTFMYQCINITAVDSNYGHYDGVYSVNMDTLNGRAWFTNGNTGFDLYYVPAAVMIDNAWVLEGSSNDKMSVYDVELGTWTKHGRSDDVPPYGTFLWKEFSAPPNPSSFDEIYLSFVPLLNCVPTQGPTEAPTNIPTTSTPAPTTPYPTTVPSVSPSDFPNTSPTGTPTSDPTKVCRVLVVVTPEEEGDTSVFAGSYLMQSTFKNGKFQWYNSNNGYRIFFVDDEWFPSSWVFKGDDGMDEIAVFDEGTDGHPNTVADSDGGEYYNLFYWGRNLRMREKNVLVQIFCIDSLPPTKIPTPGPSSLPSARPTSIPSALPSLYPSPAPSPTLRPTLPTAYPTITPSESPTSFPTEVCPCIFVESTDVAELEGMYQLEDEDVWVNYDNSADIHKSYDIRFMESWLITANGHYAATKDTSGRWGYPPPTGTNVWTVYERGFISGGLEKELNLVCTTCLPTPAPTRLPTPISTPSPTTPYPTTVPTLSPSNMPSAMPTPSPTLNPILPTLRPTQSPTESPTSPLPSASPTTRIPTASPTAFPTPPLPSPSPSAIPSPSPSAVPSAMPSP